MPWSYRSDRSDEIYGNSPGPVLVSGDTAANPPAAAAGTNRAKVYAADGAIDVRSHTAVLTKGSAGAYTLAAPTVDGVELLITAGSGFAHVVTCPSGVLQDGTTGAKTTYTAVAFIGSSIHLLSYSGKWNVIAKNLGTVA